MGKSVTEPGKNFFGKREFADEIGDVLKKKVIAEALGTRDHA